MPKINKKISYCFAKLFKTSGTFFIETRCSTFTRVSVVSI